MTSTLWCWGLISAWDNGGCWTCWSGGVWTESRSISQWPWRRSAGDAAETSRVVMSCEPCHVQLPLKCDKHVPSVWLNVCLMSFSSCSVKTVANKTPTTPKYAHNRTGNMLITVWATTLVQHWLHTEQTLSSSRLHRHSISMQLLILICFFFFLWLYCLHV